MAWKPHFYRVGPNTQGFDSLPTEDDEKDQFLNRARKHIEPWLSAVFQAEHLNLMIGSGFTAAIGHIAGAPATGMSKIVIGSEYDDEINKHAEASAKKMQRGEANIEDQFRSALAVLAGLEIIDADASNKLKNAIDTQMVDFLDSLLRTEEGISKSADAQKLAAAEQKLQSFLLSFASRAVSRERLHIFTTNYDRLIEYGCDLAGLRLLDRFVGSINPMFRSSRVDVDMHYNPPGIRGEPRYIEGVTRLTKLHGSLDWAFDDRARRVHRNAIPFGAPKNHTDFPKKPLDSVMIYPNPAKDVETTYYPYADLFRDFASSACRPNAVVVTYGYGFGDDHINRVLLDMLSIPSTHLVAIVRTADKRLQTFCKKTRDAQVSLLLGNHFSDISMLVDHYLPKPAIDTIATRMADLEKRRAMPQSGNQDESVNESGGTS